MFFNHYWAGFWSLKTAPSLVPKRGSILDFKLSPMKGNVMTYPENGTFLVPKIGTYLSAENGNRFLYVFKPKRSGSGAATCSRLPTSAVGEFFSLTLTRHPSQWLSLASKGQSWCSMALVRGAVCRRRKLRLPIQGCILPTLGSSVTMFVFSHYFLRCCLSASTRSRLHRWQVSPQDCLTTSTSKDNVKAELIQSSTKSSPRCLD